MMTAVLSLVLVVLADQGVKAAIQRWLADSSFGLLGLGQVRSIESPIWLVRPGRGPHERKQRQRWLWGAWLCSAALLLLVSGLGFDDGVCVGLLLGGSLSHLIETSVRGTVRDYLCLRFWPAFNLADVAILVGGAGRILELMLSLRS